MLLKGTRVIHPRNFSKACGKLVEMFIQVVHNIIELYVFVVNAHSLTPR
jgi:hypothetical protein